VPIGTQAIIGTLSFSSG